MLESRFNMDLKSGKSRKQTSISGLFKRYKIGDVSNSIEN